MPGKYTYDLCRLVEKSFFGDLQKSGYAGRAGRFAENAFGRSEDLVCRDESGGIIDMVTDDEILAVAMVFGSFIALPLLS